jgi:hypothetical protein
VKLGRAYVIPNPHRVVRLTRQLHSAQTRMSVRRDLFAIWTAWIIAASMTLSLGLFRRSQGKGDCSARPALRHATVLHRL